MSKVIRKIKTDLITLEFYGEQLQAGQDDDGNVFVGVKQACNNLCLSFPAQRRKILRRAVLKEGVALTATPSTGGNQEALCLELDAFLMWLSNIDENRVPKDKQEKIILYQRESKKAISSYFFGDESARITGNQLTRMMVLDAPVPAGDELDYKFPREFWVELARLRRWYRYDPEKHNTQGDAGRWISWAVYQRLPDGVYEAVKKKNPYREEGNERENLHHRYMTRDIGIEFLDRLLVDAIAFMRTSVDWEDFRWRWDRVRPRPGQQMKMFAPPKPEKLIA